MIETLTLLVELTRLGVRLEPRGGRLRYRPRRLVGPDLLRRLRASKEDLLRELVDPLAVPTGQPWDPPRWPDPDELARLPRDVAALAGPRDGWSPRAWAGRLRQLAARCAADHPARADVLRQAANVIAIESPAWCRRLVTQKRRRGYANC